MSTAFKQDLLLDFDALREAQIFQPNKQDILLGSKFGFELGFELVVIWVVFLDIWHLSLGFESGFGLGFDLVLSWVLGVDSELGFWV